MNPFRWFEQRRLRRWTEDCEQILTALQDGPMTTLAIWFQAMKRPMRLDALHAHCDAMEQHGYITSSFTPGGLERGWRDRRVLTITRQGKEYLKTRRAPTGSSLPAG